MSAAQQGGGELPQDERAIRDAIRAAYDDGYNHAKLDGDSGCSRYAGRRIEGERSRKLIADLAQRAASVPNWRGIAASFGAPVFEFSSEQVYSFGPAGDSTEVFERVAKDGDHISCLAAASAQPDIGRDAALVDTPEFVEAKDALIEAGVKSSQTGAKCDVEGYLAAEQHFTDTVQKLATQAAQEVATTQLVAVSEGWISTEYRLPEFAWDVRPLSMILRVIAAMGDGSVCAMLYRANGWTKEESKPTWEFADGRKCLSHHVRYWMPMPTAPSAPEVASVPDAGDAGELRITSCYTPPHGPAVFNVGPQPAPAVRDAMEDPRQLYEAWEVQEAERRKGEPLDENERAYILKRWPDQPETYNYCPHHWPAFKAGYQARSVLAAPRAV